MIKVFQAVMILLNIRYRDWNQAKAEISNPNFSQRIVELDIDNIYRGHIMDAEYYLREDEIELESLMERSFVAGIYYKWVKNVLLYF